MSKIDTKNNYSLQHLHQTNISSPKKTDIISQNRIFLSKVLNAKLHDCLNTNTLHDKHNIDTIISDIIGKIYQ